ncbi:MAG: alpha/beta hydrolase [Candidatus Aminicenantes bacterium]|nr:alpha/beta hydrolase [Candidatus Aminicenantes bacterium]
MTGLLAAAVLNSSGGSSAEDSVRLIKVGDISIAYRVFGSGDPLVLIMGYGSTMELWEPGLIRSLSASHQVILFDNRGMGNSEAGQRPFSIEQFADDTAGLVEALGLGKVHLLGWSMGALIAEEVALRHPQKVDKLILYASQCRADLYPPAPEIIQKMTDTSGTPEEQGMRFISVLFPADWLQSHGPRLQEIFYRPMGNIPPEIVGRQSEAIDSWKGCCERLGEIKHPALVIAGADDVLVPAQNSRYLAEKLPKARLALFENNGHGLMFQSPDLFAGAVTEFLKK